jgi:hypothetical protein
MNLNERIGGSNQCAHRGVREAETSNPADERESHALGEQFVRDPPPAGAERRAHRELLLAAFGADEQQVRDVCTGDQ